MAKHVGAKKYQCNLCDYKCKWQTNLRRHVEANHSGIKVICNLCEVEFSCKLSLQIHMKKKHNVGKNCTGPVKLVEDDYSKHICNICDKHFKYIHNYRSHMLEEHNQEEEAKSLQGISYSILKKFQK